MTISSCSARDNDQAKHAEDVLFDMFKSEDSGLLPIGKFLAVSDVLAFILSLAFTFAYDIPV